MIPADFHFLRPEWLFAILPALLLAALAWRGMGKGRSDWRHLVDPHLLKHLAVRDEAHRSRWPVLALALGWVLAAIAMAGPTWQRVPVPALDRLDPTIVVLSLAQSMDTADQNPSRLIAARHKVADILDRMHGGQVALVIYADMPFVAAPLTEDGKVIGQMLPELATDLMPVRADRPDLAINKAVELLKNTGAPTGRIVLVTDGMGEAPNATLNAVRAAAQDGYTVSVLGVGASAGNAAPASGQTSGSLAELAAAGNGRFMPLSADGRDLDTILAKPPVSSPNSPLQASGLTADQWVDMGSWLLIVVALLAPLAFRRGWLAVMPLAALLAGASGEAARAQAPQDNGSFSEPAAGVTWQDLWQTPDQKGASAFENADYGAAAKTFRNPGWQASALYKNGDYESAASAFSRIPGADYNRGNALARAGKLEEAVKAYDAALAANPGDADAAFNRDLVLKALEQQKKQDQQQQQNQNQDQNQGQSQSQDQKSQQQKPDDKKGDNTAQNKPDPKKDGQQKPDEQKPDQGNQNQAKNNPQNNPPPNEPQKQQQPLSPSGGANKPDAPPQPPAPPKQAEAPPPPQPAQAEKKDDPPPPNPPAAVALQPMTEQDQNREQILRMIPDDPTGLLRARIRSHYAGETVPAYEENP